jgi:hypothetical protein
MAWDGGPARVIAEVAGRLSSRLPGLLSKVRLHNHWTPALLPDPVVHADWQPAEVGLDLMPSLWVSEVQTSGVTGPWRATPQAVENVIAWRYLLGVDAYLRDVNAEQLSRQRRALVLAVRTALLYQPGVVVPAFDDDPYYSCTVQQALWQERYSNIGTPGPQGVVGGFSIQLQVDCEEQLDTWIPSAGQVDWVTANVVPIPISVPMPGSAP